MSSLNQNCNHYLGLLDAYHDGELAYLDSLEVTQHLTICQSCTKQLQTIREVCSSLNALPRLSIPNEPLRNPYALAKLAKKRSLVANSTTLWASVGIAAAVVSFIMVIRTSPSNHHLVSTLSTSKATLLTTQPGINQVAYNRDPSDNDLVITALAEADQSIIPETLNLETDEDGLYALKI